MAGSYRGIPTGITDPVLGITRHPTVRPKGPLEFDTLQPDECARADERGHLVGPRGKGGGGEPCPEGVRHLHGMGVHLLGAENLAQRTALGGHSCPPALVCVPWSALLAADRLPALRRAFRRPRAPRRHRPHTQSGPGASGRRGNFVLPHTEQRAVLVSPCPWQEQWGHVMPVLAARCDLVC